MNAIEKLKETGMFAAFADRVSDSDFCPSHFDLDNAKGCSRCEKCWEQALSKEYPNAPEGAAPNDTVNFTPTIPTESQKEHAKKLIDMSVKGAEK